MRNRYTFTKKIILFIAWALLLIAVFPPSGCSGVRADSPTRLQEFYENDGRLELAFESDVESFLFQVEEATAVKKLSGEEIEEIPAGNYRIEFDGADKNDSIYTVQVLAAEERWRAVEKKENLIAAGFTAVKLDSSDDLHRVQVGRDITRQEASQIEKELKDAGFPGWVTRSAEVDSFLQISQETGNNKYQAEEGMVVDASIFIDGESHSGTWKFIPGERNFEVLLEKDIDTLVMGKISELEEKPGVFINQEIRSALAVEIRSRVLREYLNSEVVFIDDFAGIFPGEDHEEIKEDIERTENYFLSRGGKLICFDDRDLLENSAGAGLLDTSAEIIAGGDVNWQELLRENFPEYDVTSLENIFLQENMVEARVQRGLDYNEIRHHTISGFRTLNILEMDLNSRWLWVEPDLAGSSLAAGAEDITGITQGQHILAGVNASFFDAGGRPLGLFMLEGEVVTGGLEHMNRTALIGDDLGNLSIGRYSWEGYIDYEGESLKIDGVNRAAGENELVMINSYFGRDAPRQNEQGVEILVRDERVQGVHRGALNYPLELPEEAYLLQARGEKADKLAGAASDERIELKNNFLPASPLPGEISFAVEAGPRLIENGEINITAREENFQKDVVKGNAPRTAVALTGDDTLMLVTVDGRRPERGEGISLDELANFLKSEGAISAMNLDGGASTEMVVRDFTMNIPSRERKIGTALLIKLRR